MFQMPPASLRAQRSNPWRGKKARMDCFAEPVIRRRFAPTGWLAMTRIDRGIKDIPHARSITALCVATGLRGKFQRAKS